jgi:S1-C subfamily serine protease
MTRKHATRLTSSSSCIVMTILLYSVASAVEPQDLYKNSLPSIATLHVVNADNTLTLGSAFIVRDNGIAVTAFHVVRHAVSVVAKFNTGEEFEVAGFVDKDDVRDVALIKIKAFGIEPLPLKSGDPAIGSHIYVIGSPRGLDFTVSDGILSQIHIESGIKYLQFTCPISAGSSGSPLIDSQGDVVGVVTGQIKEGQNLNFAIPSQYVLGLDSTLPTSPWTNIAGENTEYAEVRHTTLSPIQLSNAEFDRLLLNGAVVEHDVYVAVASVEQRIAERKNGYRDGVPPDVYSLHRVYPEITGKLQAARTEDRIRDRFRVRLLDSLASCGEALEFLINSIKTAQKENGWGPEAVDLFSQAEAAAHNTYSADYDTVSCETYRVLTKEIELLPDFPKGWRWKYSGEDDSREREYGILSYARDQLWVAYVTPAKRADGLGLKACDRIVSVEGTPVNTLAEFYDLVRNGEVQRIEIEVIREGKMTTAKRSRASVSGGENTSGADRPR